MRIDGEVDQSKRQQNLVGFKLVLAARAVRSGFVSSDFIVLIYLKPLFQAASVLTNG